MKNDHEVGKIKAFGLSVRAATPAILSFIFNEKNELLLQQRADNKYNFAYTWKQSLLIL